MKQRKINFVKLLKGYKAGWVGISTDHTKVVAYGKTLEEAVQKAKKVKQPAYYFPVEKAYSPFIGFIVYVN